MNNSETQKTTRRLFLLAGLAAAGVAGFAALTADHGTGKSAAPQTVRIENAWSPALAGAASRAVYLTIVNDGDIADRVIDVSSDISQSAAIHQSQHTDGVMRMTPVAGELAAAAHSQVTFEPGGLHIMLMNLQRPPAAGDRFRITVTFERAGAVEADVAVRSIADAY